jgi:hypothetical protein
LKHHGNAVQALHMRESAFSSLNSKFTYTYYTLKSFFYPFLITFSAGACLVSRKRTWFIFLFVMLFSGIFCASATTSKAEVATIFLVLALFAYIYRCGKIGVSFITITVLTVLFFPALIYFLLYSQGGAVLMLKNLWLRLFYSPAEVIYYYFRIFPDNVGYLFGRSIGKFAMLFNMDFFPATTYVAGYMNNFTIDYGSANAAFMGDANANFGMAGVLLEGVISGFILQSAQIFVLRQKKTVLGMALFAFLIYGFWQLNSTSLQVTLLSGGIILSFIIYWMMLAVRDVLQGIFKVNDPAEGKALNA